MAITVNTDKVRAEFFEAIFGSNEGYICIAHAKRNKRNFIDQYFQWPKDIAIMMEHIEKVKAGHNVWFCAQLLETPKRVKENVGLCYALWADLDTCDPNDITPRPPIIVESSVDRWQGFWPLERGVDPTIAEDYSHRIAYAYRDKGVDKSGWDLTQLLRVPYTFNYKYPERPIVEVELDLSTTFDPDIFRDEFEPVPHHSVDWVDPPERILQADTVLGKYTSRLEKYMLDMYTDEPAESADWSAVLWKFMRILFEVGMTREEVYSVASTAACNKFHRDGKPERLWPDVLRAEAGYEATHTIKMVRDLPVFNTEYHTGNTFVEEYADWAETLSDAPRLYHEASAFIILSSILSSGLEIETSVENFKTNLWIMILGETTITRKSTAMRLAVRLIGEVDEDILLATDEGSIEGIMDAMQARPHRASLFYRDEIAGMFKSMARKDYLSGMLESLTKLYDGDNFKRLLRKEVIHVREPIFIFYGGGIKNAALAALHEEHLTSGFVPRFLWVIGETRPDKIRPLGKRKEVTQEGEAAIISKLRTLHSRYNKTQVLTIAGQEVDIPTKVIAELTDEAWELYNAFDTEHISWAADHPQRDILMPVMSRTSVNCLKMASLLAASHQEPSIDERIVVQASDVAHAIKYVKAWMPHTIEVIRDAGANAAETLLQRVLSGIKKHPGVARSTLMRNHRLSAREMQMIQDTLRERMLIRVVKDGRQELHYAMD